MNAYGSILAVVCNPEMIVSNHIGVLMGTEEINHQSSLGHRVTLHLALLNVLSVPSFQSLKLHGVKDLFSYLALHQSLRPLEMLSVMTLVFFQVID